MRAVLTPKAPPSEPMTITDLLSVTIGSGGHGYEMDALILTFRHGDVVANPLTTYVRVEVLTE